MDRAYTGETRVDIPIVDVFAAGGELCPEIDVKQARAQKAPGFRGSLRLTMWENTTTEVMTEHSVC